MATGKARRRKTRQSLGIRAGDDRLVVNLPPGACLRISPEMFWRLCGRNPDLRLERTAKGKLIVMAPAGAETGGRNADLVVDLGIWTREDGSGKVFDSSAGFTLPNGAVRAPDASWIRLDRWQAVPPEARKKFAPICPDFVIELRSPSDSVPEVRRKMVEYLEQGARLGWLLDPITGRAEIYRPGREPEVLDRPATLSGEDVLPGFVLDLQGILGDPTA